MPSSLSFPIIFITVSNKMSISFCGLWGDLGGDGEGAEGEGDREGDEEDEGGEGDEEDEDEEGAGEFAGDDDDERNDDDEEGGVDDEDEDNEAFPNPTLSANTDTHWHTNNRIFGKASHSFP